MENRVQPNMPGAAALVAVAICTLLLPWLGETLFYSKGEPREAIVAVTMLQSGDWILPVSYGGDIPYKPPFLAWLIAAFAWLFNGGTVNEYISRLPSALAAIAMVMGGYAWAARERGTRFAVFFSFATIFSFEVFRAAMACRVDMVVTACMVGAIYIMYHIREHSPRFKWLWYVATILLLSCATMTKGPIGALLPCFIIGVYRLLRHDRFFPTLFGMLAIVVVAFVLPSLWYYTAYLHGGEEFYDLMMEENIGRLTGTMSYESHVNPWWYNLVTLVAGLLPWTVLLLLALPQIRELQRRTLSSAALLCVTVAVLVVGFYTVPASKRSVYLLPAYPFICYGIALILDVRHRSWPVITFAWFTAILALTAPIAVVAAQIWPLPNLALAPVPWWGYAVLSVPLLSGIAWIVNRHSPSGHICFNIWAMLLAYVAVGMPMALNPKSDKAVVPRFEDAPEVYSLGDIRFYGLNFYLGDRIRPVATVAEAADLPSGTVILLEAQADTAGLGAGFSVSRLLDRGADYRHPVDVAVKE